MCSCTLRKYVRVDVQYINVQSEMCEYDVNRSVSVIKVNKGAVTYLIYSEMDQRESSLVKAPKHQLHKVTTYVLQGFSLSLGDKSFKNKSVSVLVKECLCEKWMRTK